MNIPKIGETYRHRYLDMDQTPDPLNSEALPNLFRVVNVDPVDSEISKVSVVQAFSTMAPTRWGLASFHNNFELVPPLK